MSAAWLEILRQQVSTKGQAAVARELGVSPTTISQVIGGKYPASTENIEKKIMRIYGSGSGIDCPTLGEITPQRCVDTWEKAKRIGVGAGNPATMRLYKTCRKCELRSNK